MQGKVYFNSGVKDEYKDLMRKHKASLKKTELQERLATMLKEDVLSKKEYDAKIKSINSNSHVIEEAIDDPDKME